MSWNSSRLVARLASAKPSASRPAPDSTTGRAPIRSLSPPQAKPPAPMARNTDVIAPEKPARDQPVAWSIGCRNTASENTAPKATQVISAPAATTTQPCRESIIRLQVPRFRRRRLEVVVQHVEVLHRRVNEHLRIHALEAV